jgi:hypothetical protein
MHDKLDINNIILSVIFSAMGIALPALFHLVGLGPVFMPMYLPLAVGACLLSPGNALIMGFITPLASALLTGMPPFYPPVAPIMIAQLTVFCGMLSWLSHRAVLRTVIPLVASLAVDRALLAGCYFIIMPLFGVNTAAYTAYDLFRSFPGMFLLLAVVPFAVPRSAVIIRKHSLRLYEHKGGEDEHEIR